MKFSIATPCFNSRSDLPRCVGSVRGQVLEKAEKLKSGNAEMGTGGGEKAEKLKTEKLKKEGKQETGGGGKAEDVPISAFQRVSISDFAVEHLVQDGGSTDGTVEWLLEKAEKLKSGNAEMGTGGWEKAEKLKVIEGEDVPISAFQCVSISDFAERYAFSFVSGADKGMYDAINKAWERSTGDVLAWLNADEQYLPGTLETVARYFAEHPGVDAVFGNAWIVDGEGRPLAARREIPLRQRYVTNGFLYALSCTLFYRRTLWDRGWLRLDNQYRYSSDADLVLRLLEHGVKFGHIDRFQSVFGVAGGNLSFSPAMKDESDGIKRKFGMFRSAWARRVVMAARHVEKLFRGCYRPMPAAYRFALDEIPTYREVSVPSVGTRFEYEWHRGKG